MSDFKSQTDWASAAFRKARGLGVDHEIASEDLAGVVDLIDPLLEMLAEEEISYVPDSDEIPNAYFIPLVNLLANVSADQSGDAFNDAAWTRDIAQLRRLTSARPTYEVLRVDYF